MDGTVAEGGKLGRPDSVTDLRLPPDQQYKDTLSSLYLIVVGLLCNETVRSQNTAKKGVKLSIKHVYFLPYPPEMNAPLQRVYFKLSPGNMPPDPTRKGVALSRPHPHQECNPPVFKLWIRPCYPEIIEQRLHDYFSPGITSMVSYGQIQGWNLPF